MADSIPPPAPGQRFNIHNNPYRAQRSWPPDFSKMDPKHQFRLERRYRRRTKMAYTRPAWNRGVKLTQYALILLTLGYGIFYIPWGEERGSPFEGVW